MDFRQIYRKVRKMRKYPHYFSFTAIAAYYKISKGTAQRIYLGVEPVEKSTRERLGLPAICPACRRKLKGPGKKNSRPWVRLSDLTSEELVFILTNREPMP